jgi:hypothetical protein
MKINELTQNPYFPLVYHYSQEMIGMKKQKKNKTQTLTTNEAKIFHRNFHKPICKIF